MSSHARYDPQLNLKGLGLKAPSDCHTLVCRLDTFSSIAFEGLDEEATKRVPSSMLLAVINLVPADCPCGKLMMDMIRGVTHSSDPEVRATWKNHSPAANEKNAPDSTTAAPSLCPTCAGGSLNDDPTRQGEHAPNTTSKKKVRSSFGILSI